MAVWASTDFTGGTVGAALTATTEPIFSTKVGTVVYGAQVGGLAGSCRFVLADGRTIDVEAEGDFVRPYEPFHRGGLNVVRVRTGDGRTGTAVYEVTGARHHRFFPDTDVDGVLPC